MAEAPRRRLAPLAALSLLSLAFTPSVVATCQGADCAFLVLGLAGQVVAFGADQLEHPTQDWRDCPGVVFCSDSDPVFGGPSYCPLNYFPLHCPYDHYRDFAGDGFDWANRYPAGATPDSGDQLALVGQGRETVTLNGNTYQCAGPSVAVLEASRKPLGLEPSITFVFGGASAAWPSAAIACFEGERVQPGYRDLQPGSQFPDGAWTAIKGAGGHVWTLSVGAPSPDGTRAVSYAYTSPAGEDVATFQGALLEWR